MQSPSTDNAEARLQAAGVSAAGIQSLAENECLYELLLSQYDATFLTAIGLTQGDAQLVVNEFAGRRASDNRREPRDGCTLETAVRP